MKNPHLQKKVFYVNDGEVLSGYINYEPASDIEERTYRALSMRQIPSSFRFRINPLLGYTQIRMNIIGELEIDFLTLYKGIYIPLNIDGEISHFMAKWQIEADVEKTIRINEAMRILGAKPLVRIPFWKLRDQRAANNTISEIYDMIIPLAAPQKPNDLRSRAMELAQKRNIKPEFHSIQEVIREVRNG